MAKNRGGFARVCVRIDLCKPLRPGARIRGRHSLFWQQFSYEHLEGFCTNCGSLHYSDPCSPSPDTNSSSGGSNFGPWLAAVRQRRSSSASDAELRRKKKIPAHSVGAAVQASAGKPVTADARPVAAEGWQAPPKIARRRPQKAGVIISSDAARTEGITISAGVPGEMLRAGLTETNTETPVIQFGLNSKLQTENPFSLLGSTKWAGRPKASLDACPGPSKRARPEENTIQRAKSKNAKGKGKSSLHASKLSQVLVTPSYTPDPSQEPAAVSGSTSTVKGCSGETSSLDKEVPNGLPQSAGHSHDLVLSRLKGAILGQGKGSPIPALPSQEVDTTESMVTTQLIDCSGKSAEDRSTDEDMSEDQVGSHSLPITK